MRFTDADGITHYPGGEEPPDAPSSKLSQHSKSTSFCEASSSSNSLSRSHSTSLSNAKFSTLPTSAATVTTSNSYRISPSPNTTQMPPPGGVMTGGTGNVVLTNGGIVVPASTCAHTSAITPDFFQQQHPTSMSSRPSMASAPNQKTMTSAPAAPIPPTRKTQKLSPTETNGVPLGTMVRNSQQPSQHMIPGQHGPNMVPPNTKFVVYPPQQPPEQQSSAGSSNSPQLVESVSPFSDSMTGSLSSDNTTSNRSQAGFSVTSV